MKKLSLTLASLLTLLMIASCAVEPTQEKKATQMTSSVENNLATELRPTFMVYNQPEVIFNIQRRLNSLGYNAGTPDGVVGPKTSTALIRFQRAEGIAITGQLNEATLRSLDYLPVSTTEVYSE